MGGGGKKGGVPVYDFLMSVDYGLCHGPLDLVNEVWIKDKRVLCGRFDHNQTSSVHLPDLFGGDDGEGGPSGAIEIYLGTADQVASGALATRFEATPETWPGYQGVAHLFFRGAAGHPGDSSILGNLGFFGHTETELDSEEVTRDMGTGFRWTSNNPYMPTMKAHVSRFPSDLGEAYRYVYPFDHYDEETGDPVPVEEWMFIFEDIVLETDAFDSPLLDLTPSLLAAFDDGVSVSVEHSARAEWNSDGTGAGGTLASRFRFLDSEGAVIGGWLGTGGTTGTGDMAYTDSATATVPDGAAQIEFDHYGSLFVPIAAHWENISFRVTVVPVGGGGGGSGPGIAGHCNLDDRGLQLFANANPAHIIYEAMVNDEWGKGEDPSAIDTETFEEVAETLYNELFGLSMIWVQQEKIRGIVQDVLDHIKGFLFINPMTGLWQLKLLRNDYDLNTALELDESNCRATKRKRRGWGEIINEIVVSWTDPDNEEPSTCSAQDDAGIELQGYIVSETREYSGIRDPWLAQVVAERDVRESAYPLYSAVLEVSRKHWTVLPGDVVKFSWAADGIENMAMRVMSVNYGKPKDRTIRLAVTEDIFALEQTQYVTVPEAVWDPRRELPEPLDHELAMTTPLPLLMRLGIDPGELDADYPGVGVMFMGAHDDIPIVEYQVVTDVTLPSGGSEVQPISTSDPMTVELLEEDMDAAVTSRLPVAMVDAVTQGLGVEGTLLMLGSSEAEHELVMLESYEDVDSEWVVRRGIWDTLPTDWPAGTKLWSFDMDGSNMDPAERAAGEDRTYRLLPRTTEGRLAYDSAADVDLTVSERPHLPFRPANTQLDGAGFELLAYTEPGTVPTEITATWANRNRLTEDTVYQSWDDPNVAGEPGQTATLRVYDLDDTLITEYTGETGTTKDIPVVDLGGEEQGCVEFIAVTSTGESLWNAKRYFDLRELGYGYGYGYGYGGG